MHHLEDVLTPRLSKSHMRLLENGSNQDLDVLIASSGSLVMKILSHLARCCPRELYQVKHNAPTSTGNVVFVAFSNPGKTLSFAEWMDCDPT